MDTLKTWNDSFHFKASSAAAAQKRGEKPISWPKLILRGGSLLGGKTGSVLRGNPYCAATATRSL